MLREIVRIECMTCGKDIPIPATKAQLDAKLERHAATCKPRGR